MNSTAFPCRHCLRRYRIDELYGCRDISSLRYDEEGHQILIDESNTVPWSQVALSEARPAVAEKPRKAGLFRRRNSGQATVELAAQSIWDGGDKRADLIAKQWAPICPLGHLCIDALSSDPFVVTIAGNTGSSKTTLMLALAWDLSTRGSLGPFAITSAIIPSQVKLVQNAAGGLYVKSEIPPATKVGEIHDGWVFSLQWPSNARNTLAIYDVPGEVISDPQKSADKARFLYSSSGIVLVLDPDGFPSLDNPFVAVKEGADRISPQQIATLADGIEQVHGMHSQDLHLPLVVAVGKQDLVQWDDARNAIAPTREALRAESDIVRTYLAEHQLEPLVRMAETRFGRDYVRFARYSALNMRPEEIGLHARPYQPVDCWTPVAQLLDLSGRLG